MSARKADSAATERSDEADVPKKECGIVMPIAAIGEVYSADHWRKVQKILQKAILAADMAPKLVWESAEQDVIHSKILQNLYENDVVVCDLSGLNPNVMLEAGLRLSTKKPTILVTDKELRPPFDVSTIGYIDYQKDLEFNAIEDFIERLSKRIKDVHAAYEVGRYVSFVENFKFESVTPEKIEISGEQYLKEQIDAIASIVKRLDREKATSRPSSPIGGRALNPTSSLSAVEVEFNSSEEDGKAFYEAASLIPNVRRANWRNDGARHSVTVYYISAIPSDIIMRQLNKLAITFFLSDVEFSIDLS